MTKSWFEIRGQDKGIADIAIFGEIGDFGVTASDFRDALDRLGNVSELRVSISSAGGDVFTGFAIYNMLRRAPAHKIVTIEGLAASMASVIAMAGDEVAMPENSMIMIHNPMGFAVGESQQVISFGEALGKMQAAIVKAYRDRTGLPRSEISAMMDRETWLSASEAVDKGFADRLEKPRPMNASYNLSRFRNVPASLGQSGVSDMAEKTEAKPDLAHARIRALCIIAGDVSKADTFIAAGKSEDDVRAELVAAAEAAAKAKPATEVVTQHKAAADPLAHKGPELDTSAIYARYNKQGAFARA